MGEASKVVTDFILLQSGSWEPVFAISGTADMTRFVTSDLVKSWLGAMAFIESGPIVDGCPVSGYCNVDDLELLNIIDRDLDGKTAIVEATLRAISTEAVLPDRTVKFMMHLERERWRIDDIDYGYYANDKNGVSYRMETLRGMLSRPINATVSPVIDGETVGIDALVSASSKDTFEKRRWGDR